MARVERTDSKITLIGTRSTGGDVQVLSYDTATRKYTAMPGHESDALFTDFLDVENYDAYGAKSHMVYAVDVTIPQQSPLKIKLRLTDTVSDLQAAFKEAGFPVPKFRKPRLYALKRLANRLFPQREKQPRRPQSSPVPPSAG